MCGRWAKRPTLFAYVAMHTSKSVLQGMKSGSLSAADSKEGAENASFGHVHGDRSRVADCCAEADAERAARKELVGKHAAAYARVTGVVQNGYMWQAVNMRFAHRERDGLPRRY